LKKGGIDRKPENKRCQKNEKRPKISSKFYSIEVGAPVSERYGRLIVDLTEEVKSVACFRLIRSHHPSCMHGVLCRNQSSFTCHFNHRPHPPIGHCVVKFNFEGGKLLWTASPQTQFG
jgi:hypothetical protein